MSEWLIPVVPVIEMNATCPSDGFLLKPIRLIIPGIHCLAETKCEKCNQTFYRDFPIGHSLWAPATINISKKELIDPLNMDWYNKTLFDAYLNQNNENIVPVVHKYCLYKKIVIINCLDFIYGHSLLKLLNVQYYLDNYKEIGVCVIAPTAIMHLIPDGVAEIWELKVPFKKMMQWFTSLECWISEKVKQYDEVFLSPVFSHPNNHNYDINRFISSEVQIPDVSNSLQPVILFVYREDRLWGKSIQQQNANIVSLYKKLKRIFPMMTFVIIGFGKRNNRDIIDTSVIDLRTDFITVEQELKWIAYMRITDCAIGVHGSNMLLPTGYARSVVELVPFGRYGNVVQDFLFANNRSDIRDVLLNYKLIYGNNMLTDVKPLRVVDLVVSNLSFSKINSKWFTTILDNKELLPILDSDIYKRCVQYLTKRRGLVDNLTFRFIIKKTKKIILKIMDKRGI